MIFKKISHGILVASLSLSAITPRTLHAAAGGGSQIPSSDNQTLILAQIILGGAGMIIGASKIYANKEGKTKQQKRDTLIGAGFFAAGAATLLYPALNAHMGTTKRSGLITKPLPALPAGAKAKHLWKQWFNTWLNKF